MRLRSALVNAAAVAVSLATALVAGEIALRTFPGLLPPDVLMRLHWTSIIDTGMPSIADDHLGFRYPANYEGRLALRDFDFRYRTDANGFRNDSPLPETADVVVLGDSLTFSYGVDDDEAWVKLLNDRLDDLSVVNLGLIGASPRQSLRVYRTFGRAFSPKVVLFALFTGNDITDEGQFDRWVDADVSDNFDVWRFRSASDSAVSRLLQRSYVVMLAGYTVRNVRERSSSLTIDLPSGARLNLVPRLVDRAEPGDPAFERVMSTIQRAAEEIAADGSRMVVLLLPTKEEVYLPLHGMPPLDTTHVFARALDKRGLPYFNITADLQTRAATGEQLFFEVDGHPNAAGYRAIADSVHGYLMRNGPALGLSALR